MNKNNRGQSLLEVVIGVAIMTLTLSGVVALLVFSMGARAKGLDRKAATEVANRVMEGLVEQRNSSPAVFWQLNNQKGIVNELGYYANFTRKTDTGCSSGAEVPDCVNVEVGVTWPSQNGVEEYKTVRYFTRY